VKAVKDTHVPIHDLLGKVDNKFLLCIAVARRARQIKEGAKPLYEGSDAELPVISAMEEILFDKVGVIYNPNAEIVDNKDDDMRIIRRKIKPVESETAVELTEEEDKKNAARLKKKEKLEKSKKRNKSLVA
jgi:DNA-directed RNA polymerase omega subunit